MSFIGADFLAALKGWQYPVAKQLGFWRGLGLFVFLVVLFQLLQVLAGLLCFMFLSGGTAQGFFMLLLGIQSHADAAANAVDFSNFLKATLIGLFPAAVPTAFLALYLSRFALAKKQGQLALNFPAFGILGWAVLIVGFVVSMALLSAALYGIFQIDPAKQLGLVEKTITALAKEPYFFVLVLPSLVLGAPLAEEILFRGVLFAALTPTFVGRFGAVVISAALWAAAHMVAAPLINVGLIFMMGLVLGVLLLRTGSLWVTIACHTAWNAMVSLSLMGHS